MAGIKDLAIFKLVGSVFKKGKDKATEMMSHQDDVDQKSIEEASTKPSKETSPSQETKKSEPKAAKKETAKKSTKPETKVKSTKTTTTAKKSEPKTAKKVTAKKSEPKKPVAKKEALGAKREAKIKLYTEDVKKHYGSVDTDFLNIVVKNLGPSIYRKDAESVSCTDPKELETVRKNFCLKKLGFEKSQNEMLDSEIKKVCETMKDTRIKYRATFYYILAKNLKKESALN